MSYLLNIKNTSPFGVENPRKRSEHKTKKSERKITCFDAIQTGGTTLPAQGQFYRARKAGGYLDGGKLCDIFTYTQKGKIKPNKRTRSVPAPHSKPSAAKNTKQSRSAIALPASVINQYHLT